MDEQVGLMASWAATCASTNGHTFYPVIAAIQAVRQLLAPYASARLRGEPAADVFIHAARLASQVPPNSPRELHALAQCLKQVPLSKLSSTQKASLEPGFKLLWQSATKRDAYEPLADLEALAPQISLTCAKWIQQGNGVAPVSAPEPEAASRTQQASASLAAEQAVAVE